MFVQNPGARASGTAPQKKRGTTASVSSASVAPMMNRGFAERCVSCFWKTLETGLATILANTNRAVSMRRLCFGGHLNALPAPPGDTPFLHERFQSREEVRIVDCEHLNRDPADGHPASEFSRPPLEMPTPLVL